MISLMKMKMMLRVCCNEILGHVKCRQNRKFIAFDFLQNKNNEIDGTAMIK